MRLFPFSSTLSAAGPRRFGIPALLLLVRLIAPLSAGAQPPAAAPATQGAAQGAARHLEDRRLRYLEIELAQLERVEPKSLGPMRLGAGMVASAALAEAGRDRAARRADTARWAEATLAACGPRRFGGLCERALLPLQRTLLQYPEALPPGLRERVRAAAAVAAPPPSGKQRTPWGFKETENGRLLTAARSLVAHALAGTPASPGAAAWGEVLAEFLRARDRAGWYEAQSPGYMGLSITYLLHVADLAPQPQVRELAARQLDVLLGAWAQEQVAGFPAGVQSRAYAHWALGTDRTPWRAWAWLVGGLGEPAGITFLDWPDLAVSRYRVPEPVARLLAGRRAEAPYEIRARRTIDLGHRRDLDTALYSWATPDYVLGSALAVDGLRFGVSGGQEIQATLFAECAPFAPLYLWSRVDNPRSERWRSWAKQDLAMGHRNVVLARLGIGGRGGQALGHAYLSPPWSRPEAVGDAVVSRCGDTYVALVTVGGWDIAEAPRRFADLYGAPELAGSWAAVPRRQPADVALEVGRRAEHGDFAAWRERAGRLVLRVDPGAPGPPRPAELRFTSGDGTAYTFQPGVRATVAGQELSPRSFPLLAGPFVASLRPGEWTFSLADAEVRLEADAALPGIFRTPRPAERPIGRNVGRKAGGKGSPP